MRVIHFRVLLVILGSVLAYVLYTPKRLPSGGIITSAGDYAPADQSWRVKVAADGQYEIHPAPTASVRPYWEPKRGWFLYIEDAKHLWTFDGRSQLSVDVFAVFTDHGSIARYGITSYAGVVPEPVPPGLATRGQEECPDARRPEDQAGATGTRMVFV